MIAVFITLSYVTMVLEGLGMCVYVHKEGFLKVPHIHPCDNYISHYNIQSLSICEDTKRESMCVSLI